LKEKQKYPGKISSIVTFSITNPVNCLPGTEVEQLMAGDYHLSHGTAEKHTFLCGGRSVF
jgi:hypothetical protein